MLPEVVRDKGHDFVVDWWALGILAYGMMYGTMPFKGRNCKEMFWNVLMRSPEFIRKLSALTDLIEKLLEKDPTKRLGYMRGAEEIKEHEFFRGVRSNIFDGDGAAAVYSREGQQHWGVDGEFGL